jgi:hypothetical protein
MKKITLLFLAITFSLLTLKPNFIKGQTTYPDSEIQIVKEGNYLVFYAMSSLFAFEIHTVTGNEARVLGKPEKLITQWMIASNLTDGNYKVAIVAVNPISDKHAFMRIPIIEFTGVLTFDVLVNDWPHTLTYDSSVGIQTHALNSFILYPNPSSGIFKIKSSENEKTEQILVRDITGRTVFQTKKYVNQIDLSPFGKNIYFLTFKTKEGIYTIKAEVR